ncbi:unnamed protein product [Rotaria socialis]|uniref:Uncharacterized protein n=1 Tax=Rotaria socialis TaxID=392032 RepID=A0A818TVZ1_9BILA|nr:unnamed protein product [Rotaria socialis]CAF4328743.1 unnamed protein product [Rotaria socialis]
MISIKVIAGVLIALVVISNGQFLTPDQLRDQQELSHGARTHYDLTGGRRTDMFHRVNPDYLLRGFFPFWSIVLIVFALIFLTVGIVGFIGYLLGCRRPTAEEIMAKELQLIRSDDEALLGGNDFTNINGIRISTNDYTHTDEDFHYKSSPLAERIRIGQISEDMV